MRAEKRHSRKTTAIKKSTVEPELEVLDHVLGRRIMTANSRTQVGHAASQPTGIDQGRRLHVRQLQKLKADKDYARDRISK